MIARFATAALRRARAALLVGLGRRSSTQTYITAEPSPQTALDLFAGEWTTILPEALHVYRAGTLPLCYDTTLRWAIDALGGMDGRTVLELGPLEGAHSFALERAGAASITAIEANPRAFLRCLVFKELTGLTHTQFLCGDFIAFLRRTDRRFDVGVASGVLYHMEHPVELIARLAATCDAVYIWTHYYDAARIAANPRLHGRFGGGTATDYGGYRHTRWRQHYLSTRFWKNFCGGSRPFSQWLTRDDILGALRHFGFDEVTIGLDEPAHENGPALALIARRGSVGRVSGVDSADGAGEHASRMNV